MLPLFGANNSALRDTNIKQTEEWSSESDEILTGEQSEEQGAYEQLQGMWREEKKMSEVSSINSAAAILAKYPLQ